jgi:hypothetical protein
MATIKLSNDQLRLIQKALDFYSRVGILQFEEILNHPTIDNAIDNQFTPKKELEVGDDTMRGKIVEIGKGYIKTKGSWSKGVEIRTWTDVDKIKLSPDWSSVHDTKDKIKDFFTQIKHMISGEYFGNGNYGIYNDSVDESCRKAYDIIQIIRHEFWKSNPIRSEMTVGSSINLSHPESKVEVELDTIKEIRKQKLDKIKK